MPIPLAKKVEVAEATSCRMMHVAGCPDDIGGVFPVSHVLPWDVWSITDTTFSNLILFLILIFHQVFVYLSPSYRSGQNADSESGVFFLLLSLACPPVHRPNTFLSLSPFLNSTLQMKTSRRIMPLWEQAPLRR